MTKTVIKIKNLTKEYRVGELGTGTISHDLNRWWQKRVLRKEDPYRMITSANDRTKKAVSNEIVCAIRDISFEVDEGEVIGIIGKNGAGKSTLLKILSRITAPTRGTAEIKGRIGSLLEVGTGFHPEMTGKENIYLNGTILGMTKREISEKFDEIVEFAGVAKYIDTPVKRYSSGMTVRLGFAIAAFLEPEILIVDEVLAVGDAEFQNKAVGKMQDISGNHGRTVLFVSHNMASIKQLCNRTILLENGIVNTIGKTEDIIEKYLTTGVQTDLFGDIPKNHPRNAWIEGHASFTRLELKNSRGLDTDHIKLFEPFTLFFEISVINRIEKCLLFITIGNRAEEHITYSASNYDDTENFLTLEPGKQVIKLKMHQKLTPGIYYINFSLMDDKGYPYDGIQKFGSFKVENFGEGKFKYPWVKSTGHVYTETQIIN